MENKTKLVKKNYELLNILYFWYFDFDHHMTKFRDFKNIKSYDLVKLWINKWFAKNEEQKKIDKYLLIFEESIDKYKTYQPNNLYEKIALIILFDQISRNIFRHTGKAYEYDNLALKHAKSLLEDFDSLFFCFKLTIIICMIHSEDIMDHEIIKKLLPKIKSDPKSDPELYLALVGIFNNHNDRIKMFGRIPERNKYLCRISTEKEKVFLLNV
jgi:uncharacterized protein (DUF924 family)